LVGLKGRSPRITTGCIQAELKGIKLISGLVICIAAEGDNMKADAVKLAQGLLTVALVVLSVLSLVVLL